LEVVGLPQLVFMYPLVLRLAVFVGVDRMMRALREGSETTIIAVLISAVHHASMIALGFCDIQLFNTIRSIPWTETCRES
jgi:branched-subunit amino acid permease